MKVKFGILIVLAVLSACQSKAEFNCEKNLAASDAYKNSDLVVVGKFVKYLYSQKVYADGFYEKTGQGWGKSSKGNIFQIAVKTKLKGDLVSPVIQLTADEKFGSKEFFEEKDALLLFIKEINGGYYLDSLPLEEKNYVC